MLEDAAVPSEVSLNPQILLPEQSCAEAEVTLIFCLVSFGLVQFGGN